MISAGATVRAVGERRPEVSAAGYIADGARIVAAVTMGQDSSAWYNAVLRGDSAPITVGARSNVQDNVSVHVAVGFPVVIGEDVSIGHNAVVHGCTIEDGCLIGMNATVLSGAVIGRGSLVAAGAVVLEGTIVPAGSLVAGVPAKVRRDLTDAERQSLLDNAAIYLQHTREQAADASA